MPTISDEGLVAWINEHYDVCWNAERQEGQRLCRRCGEDVWYTTKHAHNVHGDSIEILPRRHHPEIETDWQGRLASGTQAPR